MEQPPIELTLEQKANLRYFETQVERMDLPQAQSFLIALYGQMLARETLYRHLLKQEWGIETWKI